MCLVCVEGDIPVKLNAAGDTGDVLIPALAANRGEGATPDAADIIPTYGVLQSGGPAQSLVDATVFCKRVSPVEQLPEFSHRAFERPAANSIYT